MFLSEYDKDTVWSGAWRIHYKSDGEGSGTLLATSILPLDGFLAVEAVGYIAFGGVQRIDPEISLVPNHTIVWVDQSHEEHEAIEQ